MELDDIRLEVASLKNELVKTQTAKNGSDVEVVRLQALMNAQQEAARDVQSKMEVELTHLRKKEQELADVQARVTSLEIELSGAKKAKKSSDVELDRLQAFIGQQAGLLERLRQKEQELADVRAEVESLKSERLAVDVRSGGDRNIPPDTNENRNQLLAVARSLAERMENT